MNERMRKAYEAAQLLAEGELKEEERVLLGDLAEGDVVVVRGGYDRVEDVLRLARIPHRVVEPAAVAGLSFSPDQLLVINCPGHLEDAAIEKVRGFVEAGGSLVTTDWALKHVLERAFPGLVEYNGTATADDVVRVEIRNGDDPIIRGLFHDGADPLWWLEGSSYPVRILDPERVQVLLTSAEMGEKYGERPIAISFHHGEGDVLHMVSHYYLQRSETRTARHAGSWKRYASEMGQTATAAAASPDYDDLRLAEVEAAHTSLKFTRNIILDKRRRNLGRSQE